MNEAPKRKTRPLSERFWSKVDRRGPDQCWPWCAAVNEKGYGRLTAGRGVNLKAHRVAYEQAKGSIPEGMSVLHHCDNPPCCNPNHLFVGTAKDNTDDMMSKNRGSVPPVALGEKHHNAKFDEVTARKILTDERAIRVIAEDYGVSWNTIFRLKHGLSWKNLQTERSAA
jgi:HNH endonuclease